MMNNFVKTTLAVLVLAGSFNAAHAAGPEAGTTQVATADLVFAAPEAITHTLTPVSASIDNTVTADQVFANGEVTVVDGSAQELALRWSKVGNQSVNSTYWTYATISGTESSNNQLKLQFYIPFTYQKDTDGWYSLTTAASSETYVIRADGPQTVPVDTYLVSMDAAVWQA